MEKQGKFLKTKVTITIDHKATGKAIRKYREVEGISLREVARRMDVSAPYICDLELGRRPWSESKVAKYIKALRKREQSA